MITQKEIGSLLGANLGVCSFELVKDRLLPCRNLSFLPKEAKSIILFVFPYKVKEEKPKNICRYAAVPDYHEVCKETLMDFCKTLSEHYKENEFVAFIDNSPIPEVFAASAAGLGVSGKNGLLITKEYGSFVFIGEIVTDLEIENENLYGECKNCGLCKAACPVGLDKSRCLSLLTQKKGELTKEEEKLIKENGLVWGCDNCAEICPLNKEKGLSQIKPFVNGYRHSYAENEDVLGRAYAWRGEKVVKRNLNIIKDGED